MNGPTICRLPCGSARRTSKPSPRLRVRGTITSSSASQERGSPRTGSLEGCQLMVLFPLLDRVVHLSPAGRGRIASGIRGGGRGSPRKIVTPHPNPLPKGEGAHLHRGYS